MDYFSQIEAADPEIAALTRKELVRQQTVLELIPSENIVSNAVLQATGSVFTNKYSEGYPRKRYYGGNEFTDEVEQVAIDRAKALFGAEHANVQPHAGSQANMAAYFAVLNPGDTAMGMSLSEGGHLTHGHPVNFSGKAYHFVQYGVRREDELIDYDAMRQTALKEKPRIIVSGASAYPRQIDFKQISEIAQEIGALTMADIAHIAGLIIAGEHQSPFPFTDIVTTTTHKTLRGPRGGMIMCKAVFAEKIDKAIFPGLQGGPLEHVIAAKAVALKEAATPEFKAYQKQVVKNAKALATELTSRGLRLVTGGTDNHLILIDLTPSGVTGKQAQTALDSANITANKNSIPFDTRKPFDPSGLRIGTPTLTSRGMNESEMTLVGELMAKGITNWDKPQVLEGIKAQVVELCGRFPIYQ